ncbi:LVIVD repeat-containing protein [Nocardioides ultimimeridianus]
MRARRTTGGVMAGLVLCALGVNVTASADSGVAGPTLPANDLEGMIALAAGGLATMKTPVVVPSPPLSSVPRARCGAGSRPLAGMQGRVTSADVASPAAKRGWTCNVTPVSRFATPGGWRVWRYRDPHGHTCVYYDTSFTAPANIISVAGGPSLGVQVLDAARPASLHHTATLMSLAMLSPHESLNLNAKRGLLAAEVGNGLTLPGTFDVYDVRSDCRHPRLLAQRAIPTGHESGFSPDGRTFWVAGGAGYITAFDLTNPRQPRQIWKGAYYAHGISVSADGRTIYQTDPINGNLGILDVSQVQDRVPDPRVHDISRITWPTVSIPQNSVPFTRNGHHYLAEFDEFAFRFNPATIADKVGAARIINIDHPARPRVVANVRLAVNMRANHIAAHSDPSPLGSMQVFGGAMHYCAVPTRNNPTILVCSALTSGLRIFDIRNPARPKEVGYFVAPPKAGHLLGLLPGDFATSQPAFDPRHRVVYYSDAGAGLYALRLNRRAWPR